mgnify:CR=1 FL=1
MRIIYEQPDKSRMVINMYSINPNFRFYVFKKFKAKDSGRRSKLEDKEKNNDSIRSKKSKSLRLIFL